MTLINYRTRPMVFRALGLAAVWVGALGIPTPGQAQEIGEIVVTARKVAEKSKDVPVAITAFDDKAIESAGITNLQDVANLTPGLSFFNAFGENLPVPVIRGIVPQDIFGQNATAIFVDGVYVSGREGLNFSQLDIERIEVLKGPQSAQYGRNAFSGAINYVTKAPSDVFESRAEVEAGNRGKQRVLAMVSGPLVGDTLTGRVSAMYDEWDGSYDNSIGNTDIGGYTYRSLQGKLRWRPADALDVNLGLYYSRDTIDDPAAAGLPVNCEDQVETTTANAEGGPLPRLQNWCGPVPGLASLPEPLDPAQFPNRVPLQGYITSDSFPHNPVATGEKRELVRGNLNIVWDADFGTFSFLTGYSDTKQNSISDFERSAGVSIPLAYCRDFSSIGVAQCLNPANFSWAPMGFVDQENGVDTEELSQEIRFTSPRDQRFRYATGFYYYHVDGVDYPGDLIATTKLPESVNDIGIGPVAYPTSLAIGSYIFGPSLTSDGTLDPLNRKVTEEKTEAWSIFGSAEFDITEGLTANAEIRLAQERQDNSSFNYATCGDVGTFPFFETPQPVGCGDDYWDLRVAAPVNVDEGTARFKTVTGRAGLKYKFESGWMAYGSIAYGEKPGGLQLIQATVILPGGAGTADETLVNPFDPETITAYEIGIKGFTADRRVGLDMAIFYNDWREIVLRQLFDNSPQSGLPFDTVTALNVNSGDAHVWGWEMTSDIAFTDTLTGRMTIGYTDSQLTNARMDTFSLFPSFYTTEPSCAPSAIQALPEDQQDAKAGACQQMSGDVSGNTQMRQPEYTASASLTYKRPLSGDWNFSSRIDGNYIGKIYVGNDNQGWLPARTNVNFRVGIDSPRYTVEFWVRNLLNNDDPIAAFRDIYWTNDDDIQGKQNPPTIRQASTFDDFPPLRLSVTYPSLRTFGLVAKVRFGGED